METYTCKVNLKNSENLKNELEELTVIYNDLELSDHNIQYTVYCSRHTAQSLKDKGFCLHSN